MLIWLLLLAAIWLAFGFVVLALWFLVVPAEETLPTDRLARLRQLEKR